MPEGQVSPIESPLEKAQGIVSTNPALAQHPDVVSQLAQTPDVPGHVIGGATKFVGDLQGFKDAAQQHSEQTPHAGGFWSDVTNYASGAWNGVKSLGTGLLHTVNRVAGTAAELGTGGLVGEYGLGHFSQNLNDASKTITNVAKVVNPFEDWRLLGRSYAYWQSQAHRNGNAYAAGELLPIFASSLFGGEALDTAGIGTDAASIDAANLARLERLSAEGKSTPDMLAQQQAIATRVLRRQNLDQQGYLGVNRLADLAKQKSAAFGNAFKAGDKIAQWGPGALIKGASKALGGQVGGLRTNLLYGLTATHAAGSTDNQALWNNPYVQKGIPVDVYGRPMATSFGESLAGALDQHQGLLDRAITDLGNQGQFFVSEPFGLGIGIRGTRNTVEGAGSILSHWWPGIGVETGADVLRTADATPRVRRAYQFMAEKNLAEIKKAFPRMYTEQQYKWIAQASTPEEVINIHADIADAVGLTRASAPTLGLGRFLITKSRSGLMAWQKASENYSQLEHAVPEILDHYGVVNFKPTSAMEASGTPIIRGNATLRRWVASRVTKATMYAVDAASVARKPFVETQVFNSSDKGAINAIEDMLKATGRLNDRQILTLADTLHSLPPGADMAHALTNGIGALLHGSLTRLMDSAVLQPLDEVLRVELNDLVSQMFKMTDGGRGRYSVGALAEALDRKMNPADATQTGLFGFADSHIANMVIPDPRYVKNLVDALARAVVHTAGTHMGTIENLTNVEAVTEAAQFAHASLEGVGSKFLAHADTRVASMSLHSQEASSAYKETANELTRFANNAFGDKQFTNAEQFARVLSNVSKNVEDMTVQMETDKSLALVAKLSAYRDFETMLKSQITDLGMSDSQIKTIASRLAETSGTTGKARAELRQSIEDSLAKARDKSGNFTSGLNHTANGINHALSKWFVPLMLSTGGYITRITGSEVLLNLSRIGGPEYIQSMIARSVAKELGAVGRHPMEFKYAEHTIAQQVAHLVGGVGPLTRDVMKGTAYGAAAGIAKSIDAAEFGRLIGHAAEIRVNHDSWPDVGHATTQLFAESEFKQGTRQMVYGTEEKHGVQVPKISRGYRSGNYVSADGTNAVTALRDQLALFATDPALKPAVAHLQQLLEASKYKTLTNDEYNKLWEALTEVEHQRILAQPAYEQSALRASTWPIADPNLTTGDAVRDLAKTRAYNVLSMAFDRNKANDWVPNKFLVEAMATSKIPASSDLSKIMEKRATTNAVAKNLPVPVFTKFPISEGAAWYSKAINRFMAVPSFLNERVVDRLFGHMISWASREPIYLWEYHLTRDALQEKVDKGIISLEDSMLEAQNSAFSRTIKFVHNPADRFTYEARTRAFAPFWFAKNQMYRRGLRVFEEDPQAFYNYLRYSTLATIGIGRYQVQNAPAWLLPFSDTPAWLIGRLAKYFPTGLPRDLASALGFELAGSPSSLASVLPTGTSYNNPGDGLAQHLIALSKDLGSAVRPDVSPPVAVTLESLAHLGLGQHEWYDKAVKSILGPIGSTQGVLANLIPSTFYRGVATVGAGAIGAATGMGEPGPIAQLEVRAQNSMLDKWMSELIATYRQHNPIPQGQTPSQEYVNNEAVWAQFQITNWLNNPTKQANFINESRGLALGLYVSRLMIYFPSPVSVYLKEQFSKAGNLDKYLAMKDIHGNPLSYSQAMARYAYHEPANILDVVSHYQQPYGTYPETQRAVQWVTQAKDIVAKYPNLAPLLMPTNEKFYQPAIAAEIGAHLRSYDTPAEYVTAMLKTMGDNFYYNYLEPGYYKAYGTWLGPDNPQNNISYEGYKALQLAAQKYAMTNLAWQRFGSPLSATTKNTESAAISQAKAFLADPSAQNQVVKAGLLTTSDVATMKSAYDWYTQAISTLDTLSGTAKYNAEQEVYATMMSNASKPENANIASFLQMLARTPTK